jgi:hypothetical protein
VSFAAVTLCVASKRVFIVVVYFIIDSVRKLLDTPAYEYVVFQWDVISTKIMIVYSLSISRRTSLCAL